ncbi:MAG: DUF4349 domain-containing protein [Terracidiphilus sp.]|jgi:anti-sigma factor RsiW
MNLTTHSVTPEELMAWLDGEVSSAEAQAVSAHVEGCVECANLATQFRDTAQALSSWTVPAVSSTLEDAVNDCAVKSASKLRPAKPASYTRFSIWNWKIWAIAGGGAIAGILVLIVTEVSLSYYSEHAVAKPSMAMVRPEPAIDSRSDDEYFEGRQAATLKSGRPGAVAGIAGANTFSMSGRRAQGGGGGAPLPAPPPPPSVAPMIARTASLAILVKDIAAARSSLDIIVAEHRGYSSQITVDLSDSAPPRGIVASLRVPSSELPSALANLRAIGRVEREKQSGEEVTQQHTDLVARLQNSRATEQRLRDILAQRTGRIEDVLQVEEEIARVRGEIESMEADQKTLEHRVEFATIDLELVEEYKAQFNSLNAPASIRVHNAFVAGLDNASDTLLGIVLSFEEYGPVLLIWLVILGVPAIFVWRKYRKVHSKI